MSEPIIVNLGTFGNYGVTTIYEYGCAFVPTEKKTPEGIERKTVRVSKNRKTVRLTHANSRATVELRAYVHAGQKRFRDMRERISHVTDGAIVAELQRMTAMSAEEARKLLSLAA